MTNYSCVNQLLQLVSVTVPGGDRDGDRRQWREGDEDRTTGDWRTKPMSSESSFGGGE